MVKGGHVLGEQMAHSHGLVFSSAETVVAFKCTYCALVPGASCCGEHLLHKLVIDSRCNVPSHYNPTICRSEPYSNARC